MSALAALLRGNQIADVYVDSEVTYLMLTDGTQVTIKGLVVVQPARGNVSLQQHLASQRALESQA
jgi:hypothetical protein